jgi:hypothetical protein
MQSMLNIEYIVGVCVSSRYGWLLGIDLPCCRPVGHPFFISDKQVPGDPSDPSKSYTDINVMSEKPLTLADLFMICRPKEAMHAPRAC